jgi:hypothetical protein
MGNGLFRVDGIDVAALVAQHLGPRVLPCVVVRPGPAGARDLANPTLAPQAGEPTRYPCRGFIENVSVRMIDGALVQVGDRKITILGATLKTEPQTGIGKDLIEIEGGTWAALQVLSRDPAGATYSILGRDPARVIT